MVRLNHRPHFCHNHIDSYLVVIQCVYSETLTDYISHTCKRKKKIIRLQVFDVIRLSA